MKRGTRAGMMAVLAAALLCATSARAEIQKKRGNIVSVDWKKMEMDIREGKKTATWKVARDCSVRFDDQKEKFPDPKLQDLKPPMYINFSFERDRDVIVEIVVIEVGFDAPWR